MNPSTTFDYAYSVSRKAFQSSAEVRHVPKIKLNQVAFDFTVVAVGIRSGYLFDAFILRNPRKSLKHFIAGVLGILRQECDVFKSVVILHDLYSDQVFVVNLPKLRIYYNRATKALSSALLTWVTFLELDGSKTKVSPPPLGLPKIFGNALASLPNRDAEPPLLLHLPEDDTRTLGDIVALAACLLEFPVAYIPISDGSDLFLAGVPLDVYECILVQTSPPPSEHVMLKFSCPQATATDAPELRSEALVERLRARFTDRLEQVAFLGTLVVRHHVETKDRVAL